MDDLAAQVAQVPESLKMKVGDQYATLDDFDLERHPETRHVKVHGAGDSAALLIGRRKPDRLDGRFLDKVPVGVPVALMYVLTFAGQSRRTSVVLKQVDELQVSAMLPDHPSIVKPLGFFFVPQDFGILGMYLSFRANQAPVAHPHEVRHRANFESRAVVVIRPLFPYTLCDPANRDRSFVHCFPDEAAEKLPSMFQQLREAVASLDASCAAHNDIKENNIVVSRDTAAPGGVRVALIDWGEARRFASRDLTLAEGDCPCGGNPAHKLPSTAAGTKSYKNADYYALKCTEAELERLIAAQLLENLARAKDEQLLRMHAETQTKDQTIAQQVKALQAKDREIAQHHAAIANQEDALRRQRQAADAARREAHAAMQAKDLAMQDIHGRTQRQVSEARAACQAKDRELVALQAELQRLRHAQPAVALAGGVPPACRDRDQNGWRIGENPWPAGQRPQPAEFFGLDNF